MGNHRSPLKLEPISKIHFCCNDWIFGCKPLVADAAHRLLTLHGFRTKIPHFATKAIFEMGSKDSYLLSIKKLTHW